MGGREGGGAAGGGREGGAGRGSGGRREEGRRRGSGGVQALGADERHVEEGLGAGVARHEHVVRDHAEAHLLAPLGRPDLAVVVDAAHHRRLRPDDDAGLLLQAADRRAHLVRLMRGRGREGWRQSVSRRRNARGRRGGGRERGGRDGHLQLADVGEVGHDRDVAAADLLDLAERRHQRVGVVVRREALRPKRERARADAEVLDVGEEGRILERLKVLLDQPRLQNIGSPPVKRMSDTWSGGGGG